MLDQSLALPDLVGLVMAFGQVNLQVHGAARRRQHRDLRRPRADLGAGDPSTRPVYRRVGARSARSANNCWRRPRARASWSTRTARCSRPTPIPALKKYPHLAGNYGGAWQVQQREFDGVPGAILMTTNCLIEPRPSYADRLFTTGVVGWPGVAHIDEQDGVKDFTPVIEKALALGRMAGRRAGKEDPGRLRPRRAARQRRQDRRRGQGGPDQAFLPRRRLRRRQSRAQLLHRVRRTDTPADTVMMTLACGKYRFNKEDYGTIGGPAAAARYRAVQRCLFGDPGRCWHWPRLSTAASTTCR